MVVWQTGQGSLLHSWSWACMAATEGVVRSASAMVCTEGSSVAP